MDSMHFGEHLTIDGYGGNHSKLNDQKLIGAILDELPNLLGMNKLAVPQVYRASGNQLKDPGGWSGFVVVAESHVSVHTFPERGFVSADVYTCKNGLDADFIISYFKKQFQLKDVESNFIKRGTHYPSSNIY